MPVTAPRRRAVVVTSAIARLPKGMAPLSLVVFLHATGHSYGLAGAAAALLALGDASTTPLQGRLVDRHGRAAVLLPAAFVHVCAVAALLTGAPVLVAAFMAGVGLPPVSGCVKAAWPDLLPGRTDVAYRVESLVQQTVFLAGPLLAAALLPAGPAVPLACSAALCGGGTTAFMFALGPIAAGVRRTRGATAVRALVVATACQGMVFGGIPIVAATVAGGLGGVLQAGVTVGAALGSVRPLGGDYRWLCAGFAATLVPVALVGPGVVGFAVCLALGGLLVTPVAVACYRLVESATDGAGRTEAFAWLSTGQAVGSAAGAALVGALVTAYGPTVAAAVLPLAATVAVVFAPGRSDGPA
jgi:hypothetical protein